MKTKLAVFSIFALFYCFCSCSSDEKTGKRTHVGKEVSVNLDFSVPEGKVTKAGVIGPGDKPPTDVNITRLYMVTPSGDMLPFDIVTNDSGEKSVRLTFILDERYVDDNDYYEHVIIKNSYGEQITLDCTDDTRIPVYFSSIPTSRIQMEPSGITTPNGQPTYSPIGDKLFRTDKVIVSVLYRRGTPIGIQWNGETVDETMNITVQLNRCTGVLSCRLVIVSDNNIETTEDYFVKATGSSPAGWSARFFLVDFPLVYDINSSDNPSVGAVVSDGEKVKVALSDYWLGFAGNQSGQIDEGTTSTVYMGWGCVDDSYPYIYHANLILYKVYVSIKDPNGKVNTLVMNPDGVLNENNHLRGTVIIHVDDLANAFKSMPVMKSSVTGDNIIDIPYKFNLKKMD